MSELEAWTVVILAAVVVVLVTLIPLLMLVWRISGQLRTLIDLTAQAYIDAERK